MAVFTCRVVHVVEHTAHELLELAIDLVERPGKMLCVLAHLEARHEHAAGVRCLTGHEGNAVLHEVDGRIRRGGHIGALAHNLAAIRRERLSVLERQGVLASARQSDVARKLPYAATVSLVPGGTRALVDVHGKAHTLIMAGTLGVVDVFKHLVVDALGILDPTLGIGACNGLATKLGDLLDCIDATLPEP